MFVSAKYTRGTKPDDAMYVWLENISPAKFEACIREFLPFEGTHQDTIVVSKRTGKFYFILLSLTLGRKKVGGVDAIPHKASTPPLYHGGGVTLLVRPRVKVVLYSKKVMLGCKSHLVF